MLVILCTLRLEGSDKSYNEKSLGVLGQVWVESHKFFNQEAKIIFLGGR